MKIDILTLFPGLVDGIFSESIIGRARESGILDINASQIRDFSHDKHRRVDDTPCGGGMGMLMAAPPIVECWENAAGGDTDVKTVIMSPRGKLLNHKKAEELSKCSHLIIICGHYEGIDARVAEITGAEELSIGNYVLTGGELAACVLCDCVGRLVDGVLASPECWEKESVACGLCEYPQYTRPLEYRGHCVPDVLLGGNHADIERWRYQSALEYTRRHRPDLL
ncbi:MAG: tRNA (guanosine(37)-N1)-methyltransferase TrmD [Eubacteriales bacterium]